MQNRPTLEQLNNGSEIDIVYNRKVNCKMAERPLIVSSEDCYQVFKHYWDDGKIELLEEFKVMFLSRANRVMQMLPVSSGGITGTVADPRIILGAALKIGAVSMILAHNHPSGSLRPSSADEEITEKLKQAARYFDIKVLDHIIMSADGYYSFADEGMM
jgi:DNA repair protein RadC